MLVNSLCEAFRNKDFKSQPDYLDEGSSQLSEAKALQAFVA